MCSKQIGRILFRYIAQFPLPMSNAYADVGASCLVADGKSKLKNDSQIKELTENGILFKNGSEVLADVVICANG